VLFVWSCDLRVQFVCHLNIGCSEFSSVVLSECHHIKFIAQAAVDAGSTWMEPRKDVGETGNQTVTTSYADGDTVGK